MAGRVFRREQADVKICGHNEGVVAHMHISRYVKEGKGYVHVTGGQVSPGDKNHIE